MTWSISQSNQLRQCTPTYINRYFGRSPIHNSSSNHVKRRSRNCGQWERLAARPRSIILQERLLRWCSFRPQTTRPEGFHPGRNILTRKGETFPSSNRQGWIDRRNSDAGRSATWSARFHIHTSIYLLTCHLNQANKTSIISKKVPTDWVGMELTPGRIALINHGGLPKVLTRAGRYPSFPLRNWWARHWSGTRGRKPRITIPCMIVYTTGV